MKPILALIVGLFTLALLLALAPFAIASKTARTLIRALVAIIAAAVLVDELEAIFLGKSHGALRLPSAETLKAALAAGGKVA